MGCYSMYCFMKCTVLVTHALPVRLFDLILVVCDKTNKWQIHSVLLQRHMELGNSLQKRRHPWGKSSTTLWAMSLECNVFQPLHWVSSVLITKATMDSSFISTGLSALTTTAVHSLTITVSIYWPLQYISTCITAHTIHTQKYRVCLDRKLLQW